jgi:hypothetical protein
MRLDRAHIIPARRSIAALLSLLAVPALASAIARTAWDDLADPAPVVALHPPSLAEFESVRCAACHLDVAREWAETAHAVAWLDETYQAAIAERTRPELCVGCHAPEPLLSSGELVARATARDDAGEPRVHGITCTTCHAGAGDVVLGPRGDKTPAHATAASPFMTGARSAELCALCHKTNIGPVVGIAKDYDGSAAAAAGTVCIDCHWRPVERRWANAADGSADADVPLRVGRSHALQTPRDPAFLSRAFALEWRVADGRTSVTVTNRTGHRVPGLQGREVRFAVTAQKGGATLGTAELVLDTRAYLPVDDAKVLVIDGAADAVVVRATHVDPRSPQPMVFLDGEVAAAK